MFLRFLYISVYGRRTADVRTIGYVECFVLSKEDVLSAIRDYPEAQVRSTGTHSCNKTRYVRSGSACTNSEGCAHTVPHSPVRNLMFLLRNKCNSCYFSKDILRVMLTSVCIGFALLVSQTPATFSTNQR